MTPAPYSKTVRAVLLVMDFFDQRSRPVLLLVAGIGIAICAAGDFFTGHEAFFSVFYFAPIIFLTWYVGPRWGIAASALCAILWLGANSLAGMSFSHPGLMAWNTFARFLVFLIMTFLLAALRAAHDVQRSLARIDDLTGAVNRRKFNEILAQEVRRASRYSHPFTLVYTDVDDFKIINDQFGHTIGDQLLLQAVACIRSSLRPVDTVARLGGDEFAVLMPETGPDAAKAVVLRLRNELLALVQSRGWPVSFSFGAVTCLSTPIEPDALLQHADRLMYAVKLGGKDGLSHEVVGGE
jgi:diguanylate cyclase (GGDEF)-like protein